MSGALPSGQMTFPVKTAQLNALIGGVATDFHVSVYSDRVLIVVTQNGKPGTVVATMREKAMSGGARSLATRVLVGRRDDVILVYARRIAEVVGARTDKPVLLTLCVLDDSPEVREHPSQVFKKVVEQISSPAFTVW